MQVNYPELTPYQFTSNNPIEFVDLDGLEKALPHTQTFDPLSQLDKDVDRLLQKKIKKFEVQLSKMTDAQIDNYIDKTISNVILHPDLFLKNAGKDLDKQSDDLRNDGFELLFYSLTGQNKKAEKLTARMIVQFGPLFLLPEEKEAEVGLPDLELPEYRSTFKGGAKGKLLSGKVEGETILEGNHLPTVNGIKQAGIDIAYKDASAIQMLFDDHRVFESTGNSLQAKLFRAKEASLLSEGKYMEAFDFNADRIKAAYGNKYDEALKEARQYYQDNIVPLMKAQKKTN